MKTIRLHPLVNDVFDEMVYGCTGFSETLPSNEPVEIQITVALDYIVLSNIEIGGKHKIITRLIRSQAVRRLSKEERGGGV